MEFYDLIPYFHMVLLRIGVFRRRALLKAAKKAWFTQKCMNLTATIGKRFQMVYAFDNFGQVVCFLKILRYVSVLCSEPFFGQALNLMLWVVRIFATCLVIWPSRLFRRAGCFFVSDSFKCYARHYVLRGLNAWTPKALSQLTMSPIRRYTPYPISLCSAVDYQSAANKQRGGCFS